jgi:hypothetical protein
MGDENASDRSLGVGPGPGGKLTALRLATNNQNRSRDGSSLSIRVHAVHMWRRPGDDSRFSWSKLPLFIHHTETSHISEEY